MQHSGWATRHTRPWMLALSAATGAGCGGDVTGAASGSSGGVVVTSSASGGQGSGGTAAQGGNPEGGSALGGLSFGGNGTGGFGTGGTATGGTDPCGPFATPPVPPVVLFALDASGSMNETAPSTNGQSKWTVLRQMWPDVLAGLPASWAVGMMTWSCPDCPNRAYQPSLAVPIAPLDAAQLALLADALPLEASGGDRPTECAYDFALAQVTSWQAPAGYADSPRTIVLLTDGLPTVESDCTTSVPAISQGQYDGLIATVANGTTTTGIETFVGGLPGSDQPQGAAYDPLYELSLLAAAGGTALPSCIPSAGTVDGTSGTLSPRGTYCHYDMTTPTDLAAALDDMFKAVAGAVATCRYPVPLPLPPIVWVSGVTTVDVVLTSGNERTRLTEAPENDCSLGGEWYYSAFGANDVPIYLDFCPSTCARVSSDPGAAVDIGFQCLGPDP